MQIAPPSWVFLCGIGNPALVIGYHLRRVGWRDHEAGGMSWGSFCGTALCPA